MFAAVLGLSACASAAPQPAPNDDASTVEKAPAPEAKTDDDKGDEGFNKSGVVMMLESQLGAFGGEGHWDGDALIMKFDREFDGGDALDLAFVCDFMNGLVLEEHTTAVETPSGKTDCTL